MKEGKAKSVVEAVEMLNRGGYQAVILDFVVNADEFFRMAAKLGEDGAKISRISGRFLIKKPL